MAKSPKQRLTWLLIKENVDVDSLDAIIDPPESGGLHRYVIDALDKERDSLVVRASFPSPPKWLGYVKEHIDGNALPKVLGSSTSGVLLVRTTSRVLAVTFGYGRFLLRPEVLVQDFGLKVVLNSVDPEQIKSVDARTFDELTVHTRRGVSRDSSFSAFELDISRNLVRGITGTSDSEELPGTLTGASALAINTPAQVPELPYLATKLVNTYNAKRYRKNFKFVDHMRAEQDPAVIEILDQKILAAWTDKDLTLMHLAIPEVVDWQEITGTQFSIKRKQHSLTPDPKISVYWDLRGPDNMSVKRLKTDKVEAIGSTDGQVRGRWRVYDCLVFETDHDGHLYVLSSGDWYRIDKSYRDKVEKFAKTVTVLDLGLPPASLDDDEATYNEAAAKTIGAISLDGRPIGVGGVDRVELCDILTKDGTFIHVKKRGRSSTLSHLFAQGITSSELLLNDEAFRKDAAKLVSSINPGFTGAIPTSPGARDEIKVAYVVLSRGQRPDKPFGLPFFSLVSLQAATQRLRDAGIQVLAQEIKEA